METVRDRMTCVPDLRLVLQVPLIPRPATYFQPWAGLLLPPHKRLLLLFLAIPALPPGHQAAS